MKNEFADEATVRKHIQNSGKLQVCPQCGRTLDSGRYGTGSITDGYFCSMNCVYEFWYHPNGRRKTFES